MLWVNRPKNRAAACRRGQPSMFFLFFLKSLCEVWFCEMPGFNSPKYSDQPYLYAIRIPNSSALYFGD